MSTFNPGVDAYLEKSAAFARPILEYLRKLIHETCPDVTESIKWGIPHFDYKGDILCVLAAYKQHCSFSLFKAELMKDERILESVKAGKKMGYMDKLRSLTDLPAKKVLVAHIREAMALNEKGVKKVKPKAESAPAPVLPDDFAQVLQANPKAKEIFETKSASFRKEYIVWITGAKTEATRQQRIEQSLAWIAEGKGRFWQYAR